jgi:integrase/recombinase XerD
LLTDPNFGQIKQMLNHIDTTTPYGYRDRTLLELLYSAGLRSAEILGLNLAELDMVNRTAIVTGKGNKQRVVPIGESALRQLETYLVAIRPQLLCAGDERSAVFLNDQGRRYPYHTLNRLVAGVAKVLDVNFPVTPHTFRRSCTTEMIRGGANIYHVKELLGHENLDTLKHYTRLTITDLQKTHAKCHPREQDER